MPDIDSLNIEITSSARNASRSIDTLVKKLSILSQSLNGINTANLNQLAYGMEIFSRAMMSVNSLKMPDFTRVAKGIERLGMVNSASISAAAHAITSIGHAVGGLGSITTGAKELTDFASAVSKLGNKSVQNAIDNLPKLAVAFRDLMNTLSTAPVVSKNVIDLATALGSINAHTIRIGPASYRTAKGFNVFSNAASGAAKHSRGLASAIGKVYATYWLLFRAFGKLKEAIDLSSQLTEVQNVVDTAFGNMSYKIEQFTQNSIKNFGMSELAAKQYASVFQAMGSAMGITNGMVTQASNALSGMGVKYEDLGNSMADVSTNLVKLTADIASFYDKEQADVAEDLQSVFTGMTRPLRKYGLDLTQATLKEWALKNGMDADIDSMTQAEKTMLRYQYVMANTLNAQGDFAKTANTWANQVRILKEEFKALATVIGGTLINALKPMVTSMNSTLNWLTDKVQLVANAIGKLMGWQMEIRNVGILDTMADTADESYEIGDGLDDATASAKKLKNVMLGIDELNINNKNEEDSGTADFNVDNTDAGKVNIKPYESAIKSWYQLGRKIADAIEKALNNINWDKVYKKASNFGKNLASFLNGLISPSLFDTLGKTIANSLNTALHFLNSFGDTFNWKNFGVSIGTGINSFFRNFDWGLAADTFNKWAHGLLDALIAALKTVNWSMIGEKIGNFLLEIDFSGILDKIGEAIWLAINAGIELYTSLFDTAPFETSVMTILAVFSLFRTQFVANVIDSIAGAVGTISTFITSLQSGMGVLETFRSMLGPVGQGIAGIVGGVAEFLLVKDAVHDLAAGVGDVSDRIGELAAGIGIAAGAFTLAFGFPGGIIATGIVGLVGAIAGLSDAFDTIDAEAMGASINQALSHPGGVPVEQLFGNVIDKVTEMGESFTIINQKSEELDKADQNIADLTFEIDKIKTSLHAGVMEAEEAIPRLEQLIGELADAINTKIGAAGDVLLATFGSDSISAKAYENAGCAVETMRDRTVQSMSDQEKKVYELQQTLNGLDPTTPEWEKAYEELVQLSAGTDAVQESLDRFNTYVTGNPLDWETYLNKDGIDITKLTADFDEMITQSKLVKESAEDSFTAAYDAAKKLGDKQLADDIKKGMPDALSYVNGQIASLSTETVDILQTQCIGGLNQVIADAEKDWAKMSWVEKFFRYDNSYDNYVQNVIARYKKNMIDPLSDSIETGMQELGVTGAGWAKDASAEIISNLFDVQRTYDEVTGTETITKTLKSNWDAILTTTGKAASDTATKRGKDVVDGFNKGVYDNVKSSKDQVTTWMDEIVKAIHDSAMKFGSPSKTAIGFGKDTIDGYNQGIMENKQSSVQSTTAWMSELAKYMESASEVLSHSFDEVGKNIAEVMQNACDTVSEAVQTMQKAFDFEWSLPKLKMPHIEISGEFNIDPPRAPEFHVDWYENGGFIGKPRSYTLFGAGENGIPEALGTVGGRTAVAGGAEITGIREQVYESGVAEQELLAQAIALLQEIAAKEMTVDIDGRSMVSTLDHRRSRNGFSMATIS